jgi:hypothetical protein
VEDDLVHRYFWCFLLEQIHSKIDLDDRHGVRQPSSPLAQHAGLECLDHTTNGFHRSSPRSIG